MVPDLSTSLTSLAPVAMGKHEQWKPDGATKANHENKKKSVAEFLEYLSSTMDHPHVSMMQNL